MIKLHDVEAARARIAGSVRRTPSLLANALTDAPTPADLWLKLECLQAGGSFKARGALNNLLAADPATLKNGIVAASGGNHGIAVARAGSRLGVATTIFVPENASPAKIAKIRSYGADVQVIGAIFDESEKSARRFCEERGALFVHPFGDPMVMAGQGTVALEILEDMPKLDMVVIAIGGGGLICGMATVLKALSPSTRIIGVEATGCPTLKASVDAGHVVTVDKITTKVPTLTCARTHQGVYEIVRDLVDEIVLVDDVALLDSARWLWSELGLAADLSGAAAIAALRTGVVTANAGQAVCGLVCGAGAEGIS